MGKVKLFLKRNPITRYIYNPLKEKHDKRIHNSFFKWHGDFVNRSKGCSDLVIVLAGYKEYLYQNVFQRLIEFLPDNYDVCVVTSGKFSDKVSDICKSNNWSYLSTKENDVGLVQNVAINLHPKAEFIFKLDEDIFITSGYFQKMKRALEHAQSGRYNPGVIVPNLLINGFCTPRIIEKLGLEKIVLEKYGTNKSLTGKGSYIEENIDLARFMWGEDDSVPCIDELNIQFENSKLEEIPCPIRFSIGAILFHRSLWEDMNYFDVKHDDLIMMGKDEEKLCAYCVVNSRPIMISENIVVGHFSFGPQTQGMIEYYKEHPERFALNK